MSRFKWVAEKQHVRLAKDSLAFSKKLDNPYRGGAIRYFICRYVYPERSSFRFHTGWPEVVETLRHNVFCNRHVEVTDYFISVFGMAVFVGNVVVQDVAVQRPYKKPKI
jgi:hypothetical protein